MIAVRELPHDPTMPKLGVALDMVMMRAILQDLLFGDDDAPEYQIESCQIFHVKYKAGQKCVIGYRLSIVDPHGNNGTKIAFEQRLCARVFPPGKSFSRYLKAEKQLLVTPKYGSKPIHHLPSLGMVFWCFPNDRKMTGLAALMDVATHQNDRLESIVRDFYGAEWWIADSTSAIVHHVPEQSCMVRVELQLVQPRSSRCRHETLFGKTYYNDDGAEAWRLMQALWASPARRNGQLRIAQAVSYDPNQRILWQRGLSGQTLLTYRMDSPQFAKMLAETAHSVAALHTTHLPCTRTTSRDDWLTQLDAMSHLIATAQPELQTRLHPLLERLQRGADGLGVDPQATLHGDLHLQNFFVDEDLPLGERIALIDLDNLSTGSPWLDLGSFIAGLYYRALLVEVPMATVEKMIDTFCRIYAQNVPWELSAQALRWHTAAALLNERVFRAFTRVKAGRMALVDDLIRIAEGVYPDG